MCRVAGLLFFGCVLAGGAARAETDAGSTYEDRLVDWALGLLGREREPFPEGKEIDEVLVASEEIISESDPWPSLLNLVHVKTKESVVRRELLFREGEPFRRDLADESERTLRSLPVLAIARVVPVKGSGEGKVGVVVVTKDLWSIRMNSSYNLVGGLLQYLRLHPTEQNFLGRNKQLSLDFTLRLDSYALGQAYVDPRVWGSGFMFTETADVVLNRTSHRAEGTYGSVGFLKPLRSLDQKESYGVVGAWDVRPARRFRGAHVAEVPFPDPEAPTAYLPVVYNRRELGTEAGYTRSFGRTYKTNLTGGAGGYTHRYTPIASAHLSQEEQAFLVASYLPRSEDAVYLTSTLQVYEARYAVLQDVATFALSEDYQLGHSVRLLVRWASPLFLSPSNFVEGGLSVRYRWSFADDLLTAQAAGGTRWVPTAAGTGEEGAWVNRRVAFELSNVSPTLGVGRVALRALLDLRFADLDHPVAYLGGGNGLRGTAPEQLSGTQLLLLNAEYRTVSVELSTLHLGGVLFWDGGAAFESMPRLTHTVGLGLRLLLPQFDVEPVRIDIGWVLNGPSPDWLDRVSSSFGQVTDYRPAFLDRPPD